MSGETPEIKVSRSNLVLVFLYWTVEENHDDNDDVPGSVE